MIVVAWGVLGGGVGAAIHGQQKKILCRVLGPPGTYESEADQRRTHDNGKKDHHPNRDGNQPALDIETVPPSWAFHVRHAASASPNDGFPVHPVGAHLLASIDSPTEIETARDKLSLPP